MPGVINETLFPAGPIPPGESIFSPMLDVGGAQHVAVNTLIRQPNFNVQRVITFQHTPTDEFAAPFQIDNFGSTLQLYTLVPVHGPTLQVELRNLGSEPEHVDLAWVYGVRAVP
jgi:hypothetical protein